MKNAACVWGERFGEHRAVGNVANHLRNPWIGKPRLASRGGHIDQHKLAHGLRLPRRIRKHSALQNLSGKQLAQKPGSAGDNNAHDVTLR
jgi:hypothetical protein